MAITNFLAVNETLALLGCYSNPLCPLHNLFLNADCSFNSSYMTCDDAGNVNYLALYGFELNGTMDAISGITTLQYLDLSNNSISGALPDINSLTILSYLDLAVNNLTGTIPPTWTNLSALNILFIHGNQLVGSVPQFTFFQIPDALCTVQSSLFPGNCLDVTSPGCQQQYGPCLCEVAGAVCGSSPTPAATTTMTTATTNMSSASSSLTTVVTSAMTNGTATAGVNSLAMTNMQMLMLILAASIPSFLLFIALIIIGVLVYRLTRVLQRNDNKTNAEMVSAAESMRHSEYTRMPPAAMTSPTPGGGGTEYSVFENTTRPEFASALSQ